MAISWLTSIDRESDSLFFNACCTATLLITVIITSGLVLPYKVCKLSEIGKHVVNTRTLLSEESVVYNRPAWKYANAIFYLVYANILRTEP